MQAFRLAFPPGTRAGSFGRTGASYVASSAGASGENPPRQAFYWYVDSIQGDDANSGRTPELPLKTLAALATKTLSATRSVGLKAGSHWRESLDTSGTPGVTVGAYGTGNPPIIDGSDVVSGWIAEGTANVWKVTVTPETDGGRMVVYQDGVGLTRVADAAACSAAAGSFVDLHNFNGSPVTVKMHPTGSGNPNSNGKLYEATIRAIGYSGGAGSIVSGIEGRRVLDRNGSIDLVSRLEVSVDKCLAVDGTKHNAGLGSGRFTDVIALYADSPTSYELSDTFFVGFMDVTTGLEVTLERCGAIGRGRAASPVTAFITHSNGLSLYELVVARQFWMIDNAFAPNPNAENVSLEGGYYRDCLLFTGGAEGAPTTVSFHQVISPGTDTGSVGWWCDYLDSTFLFANRFAEGNFDEPFRPRAGTMTRCAIAGMTLSGNLMANPSSGATVAAHFTIFFGGTRQLSLAADGTYDGDFNIFCATETGDPALVFAAHDGTATRTTLATWQSSTGQDANSVTLAHADQTPGNPLAFWLGVSSGVNAGPADGDWRVNPGARAYGGDGTPHIGVFADGVTPLTDAGPQRHWDWNARKAVGGPPVAYPDVPDTLADARAYVRDPAAWQF